MNNDQELVIFGKGGQLGDAFHKLVPGAVFFTEYDADFTDPEAVSNVLVNLSPSAIINTAAYTAVDPAEENEDTALKINATAPGILAQYCSKKNIPFVHYSTDYVFSGNGSTPWKEEDIPAPLNAYGRSKLAGEQSIIATGCKHLIFRTSWVYDALHKNFFTSMLNLGQERPEIAVVNDQIGAPTYAPHLAQFSLKALKLALKKEYFPSGIFHFCNQGYTSWFDFALKIFSLAMESGVKLKIEHVNAIASSDYPALATRPKNSKLDCSKAKAIFNINFPDWEDGLKECIKAYGKNN